MYHVVEFDSNTVGVVHESWYKEPGYVMWPGVKDQKRIDSLLKSKLPPPAGSRIYAVKLHRATDDFEKANKLQKLLEELSELPSTDGTVEMMRGNKRKPKPNCYLDSSEEDEKQPPPKLLKTEIKYSPPPPPLLDMTNTMVDLDMNPAASSTFVENHERQQRKKLNQLRDLKNGTNIAEISEKLDYLLRRVEELAVAVDNMNHNMTAMRCQLASMSAKSEATLPFRLPIKNVEEMCLLNSQLDEPEIYQKVFDYLKGIGGPTPGECTRNVMNTIFTNELALAINWRGVNNKTSIATSKIASVAVESVMFHNYPQSTHAVVREKIQRWIQRARRKSNAYKSQTQDVTTDDKENQTFV